MRYLSSGGTHRQIIPVGKPVAPRVAQAPRLEWVRLILVLALPIVICGAAWAFSGWRLALTLLGGMALLTALLASVRYGMRGNARAEDDLTPQESLFAWFFTSGSDYEVGPFDGSSSGIDLGGTFGDTSSADSGGDSSGGGGDGGD